MFYQKSAFVLNSAKKYPIMIFTPSAIVVWISFRVARILCKILRLIFSIFALSSQVVR